MRISYVLVLLVTMSVIIIIPAILIPIMFYELESFLASKVSMAEWNLTVKSAFFLMMISLMLYLAGHIYLIQRRNTYKATQKKVGPTFELFISGVSLVVLVVINIFFVIPILLNE